MSNKQLYVSSECSTRTYFILSDTFKRPIEFKLHTAYNGEIKAKAAFEAAFYPCKVIEFIEPKEGMSYMAHAEIFTETGKVLCAK